MPSIPKEERFIRLFVRFESDLTSIVRTYLPDWNAVDEVLQESSLVMWRKIDELEKDEDFLRWGRVIVHFEVLKYRRKTVRDRHILSQNLVMKLIDESVHDEQSNVSQQTETVFLECLKEFSESNRELLLAAHKSRGAIKEIAAQIGCTVNSLYKKLTRLKVKLHDCVQLKNSLGDISNS